MKLTDEGLTPLKAMFAMIGIAFAAETLIYAGIYTIGVPGNPTIAALLNAVLLALVLALPAYALMQRARATGGAVRAVERGADTTQQSITDSLTRLMNQRGVTVSLLDAMAQAERYNTPLSVALADVDMLKRINESHGHAAGDKVLAHVAAVLSETLRMPDKVGRYGGEEFLVIFPHTGLAQARKIAERMRSAVHKSKLEVDRSNLQVTVSLGVTQFQKGEDLEQLLSRVDKALTQAKSGGRNLVAAQKSARAKGE